MGWPLWRHCGGGELLESDCCSRLELESEPAEAQPSNTRAHSVPWHAKNGSKRRQKWIKKGPNLAENGTYGTPTLPILYFVNIL